MKIEEILSLDSEQAIAELKCKQFNPPAWAELKKEYDPMLHPVFDKSVYPDYVRSDNSLERVVRIPYDLQRLAVKRMSELCFGIPAKRVYSAENERQQEVQNWIEAIFERNRINSVNIERANAVFASCEAATIWYSVEDPNNQYGFESRLKLRSRNFSPMFGDQLFPLFDELGDLIALSVQYQRSVADKKVTYFDCYTKDKHVRWRNANAGWEQDVAEPITLGKIPGVYFLRKTPIWENTSPIVNEIEMSVSRNGNYLRKASKPLLVVSSDESFATGKEKTNESRAVVKLPAGGQAQYVTWQQAVESLKFHVTELRQMFFTTLQLPDWSYESMKSVAMSGESRKQLFIDAMLKVKDESGMLQECLDREISIIKAFLKIMQPSYSKDIDALSVSVEITPFTITDDADTITNLTAATGGKAIMSQKTAIANLGWVGDIDAEMEQISKESQEPLMGLTE